MNEIFTKFYHIRSTIRSDPFSDPHSHNDDNLVYLSLKWVSAGGEQKNVWQNWPCTHLQLDTNSSNLYLSPFVFYIYLLVVVAVFLSTHCIINLIT